MVCPKPGQLAQSGQGVRFVPDKGKAVDSPAPDMEGPDQVEPLCAGQYRKLQRQVDGGGFGYGAECLVHEAGPVTGLGKGTLSVPGARIVAYRKARRGGSKALHRFCILSRQDDFSGKRTERRTETRDMRWREVLVATLKVQL